MRSATVPSCMAALLMSLVLAVPSTGQQPVRAESVQVLVLGTFHFENPGLDVVKTEVVDIRSAAKQAEIRVVVEALSRFGPTKVAVEHPPEYAPRLDSLYNAFRAQNHELSRNETEQLGFRLAARSEHARVYPIDHRGEFPFQAMMVYAQAHDTAFVAFVQEALARVTEEENRRQRETTIAENLRLRNAPHRLADDHAIYMRFAGVGAGDTYIGADVLSEWYDRNIRIFANLQRIAEPGDRIIVIIGSGHAPILRELITYDGGMVLVDALDYLPQS